MKKKIQTLLEQMNHGLIERENTVKSVLLTVLAGENLVLIGPPGTGKSMVARRVADNLDITQGNGYFEYLLTKFSTPEEIFGSLSISELKADRFKRNTEGYLPTVQIAFLDEIFKASSSILNSLLTILNERVFHNGSEAQKVPLLSLISASNELPTGEEELKALYDRFLVRCFVDYVREENLPKLFENTPDKPILEKLTQHDFIEIQKNTEAIIIPTQIMEAVCAIWIEHKNTFKEDNRETLSDRRLKKILKLLRTSAATNGRKDVDLSDVMLLKDCLWNHYDNAEKVRSLIIKTLQKYSHAVSITLQDDSKTTEDTASFTHNKSTTFTHNKSTTGKIKGFVGSGTEHDPILIQSLHDFVDISRPDIGTKDYYFRQTTDMDCVSLTHWKPMDFQGHYDGDGHSIKNLLKNADKLHYVFSHIKPKSSITNLKLEECVLVDFIENSKITYCQSDANLVTNAKNCEIYHCESDASLIANNADGCEVSHCESDASLIANNADGCEISHCGSDTSLIVNNADGCEISHCQTNASLIAANANDCEISRCEVGKNLVSGNATNCRISECNAQSNLVGNAFDLKIVDCAVDINKSISDGVDDSAFGSIASNLDKNSLVERCFVTGVIKWGGEQVRHFGGIAGDCKNSTIRSCAVGEFTVNTKNSNHPSWFSIFGYEHEDFARIAHRVLRATLENNAAIDTMVLGNSQYKGNDDANDKDGKTLAAVMFNQRYFEFTMGWNFETVWEWDDANNRPTLRKSSTSTSTSTSKAHSNMQQKDSAVKTEDLLVQQLRANIWL